MQALLAEDPPTIGAYRLLRRLGAGGMGRVYLGRSAGGRTVAVKVVHPHFAADEQFRARFRREIAAARRVGGGWTAPVLDADPDASVPWVATGYVAGPSLSQAVADFGPLPEPTVRALGAGLAEALAAVHALDLVHRDVKPSNVLLALDGPRLIDFGIARATDGTASLTATGVSIGSPGYMSPEQILGKAVGGPADVFSLGAVLAYAVLGEAPFPGDNSASLLYKVVHEEPRLGPELSGELRTLIVSCLAKSPGARPTPAEIARRLAPADDGGAQALIRSGWLPGPLVRQVSLRAVELLDLDSDPVLDSGPVLGSGPALGSDPVRGAGSASAADAGAGDLVSGAVSIPEQGAFGPPDPSYGGGGPLSGGSSGGSGGSSFSAGGGTGADRPGSPLQPGTPPPAVSGLVPFDRPPQPQWPTAEREDRPPGTSPPKERSIGLAAAIGDKDRPRRLSCTLVLSVAGALAAATTAALVFNLMPGGGAKGDQTSAGAKPSPSASPPAAGDGAARAAVPKAFVGTWQGAITGSGMPLGTMKVTLRKGAVGDRIGTAGQTDILGNFICEDILTVTRATENELIVDTKKGPKSKSVCTEASKNLHLKLQDGKLRYVSEDEGAGRPTGLLSPTGG
ncbi:serine/threonine protein kinase [Streptomyces sp. H27-D2]|uniref:serine/threonine protein kinase n=1 Tax=Streptomyces sp. H27-D2 TaxID=3046304 RepID=UPI002DBFCF90|nr:serine/threonine-protein kinase [Streptomyces sp. H27-D2]MEC4017031.1 serine/threonine-protein kinase [Streptomyces sp. H27-D2]